MNQENIIQRGGTYDVADGVLMDHQDKVITLSQCRVTIQPLGEPYESPAEKAVTAAAVGIANAIDVLVKSCVVGIAIYLLFEVAHAFTSGAMERVVR